MSDWLVAVGQLVGWLDAWLRGFLLVTMLIGLKGIRKVQLTAVRNWRIHFKFPVPLLRMLRGLGGRAAALVHVHGNTAREQIQFCVAEAGEASRHEIRFFDVWPEVRMKAYADDKQVQCANIKSR